MKILESKLRYRIRKIIREIVALDIEPGDVILTGKSILKFKIEKKLPVEKWSKKSREELEVLE